MPALPVEQLARIDAWPALCRQTGCDRLCKWLVVSAPAGAEGDDTTAAATLINRTLLQQVVVRSIQDGEAATALARDLARGDDELRAALQRVLWCYNFRGADAAAWLRHWAVEGPDATLAGLLSGAAERPEALQPLTDYLLRVDADWCRTVSGLERLLADPAENSLDALQQSLVAITAVSPRSVHQLIAQARERPAAAGPAAASRAGTGVSAAAVPGSTSVTRGSAAAGLATAATARWQLAASFRRVVDAHGALARVVLAQPPVADAWYERCWRRLLAEVARDPLLCTEYARRSLECQSLYDALRELFLGALRRDPAGWSSGWLQAASIPGSRFRWAVEEAASPRLRAAGLALVTGGLFRESRDRGELTERLIAQAQENSAWTDFFLWHLTRAGEAVAATIRAALPDALADNPELARTLVAAAPGFGPRVEAGLARRQGYDFYPGGAAALRARAQGGDAEPAALNRYLRALAQELAADDGSWAQALEGARDGAGRGPFAALLATTLERAPVVASAWAQTLRSNDLALKEQFTRWLTGTGKVAGAAVVDHWLDSLTSSLRAGVVVGNPEVANFKAWFGEFAQTPEGWRALLTHLGTESSRVPFPLREAMIREAGTQPPRFWRLYRLVCFTPGPLAATLQEKMRRFVATSGLAELVLDEVAAENPYAADAAAPVWEQMLAPGSPVTRELERLMRRGVALNAAFGLGNLAVNHLIDSDADWPALAPRAAAAQGVAVNDERLRENTRALMLNEAKAAGGFLDLVLDDAGLREKWRQGVLREVRFMGKAYVLGGFIKRRGDLSRFWAEAIDHNVLAEPWTVEALVESLALRRVGDPLWMRGVRRIRTELARLVVEDRVLFEQLLDDRNAGFRSSLRALLSEQFGVYYAQRWFQAGQAGWEAGP